MTVFALLGISGSVLAVVLSVWAFVKKILPVTRKVTHFIDDWFGEEERPGKVAVPGVMVRLQTIESVLDKHSVQLGVVIHELFPNSGGSLRDEVQRIESVLAQHNSKD